MTASDYRIASDYRMAPWGVGQIAYRTSFASLCAGGCCHPDLNQIACIDANAFMAAIIGPSVLSRRILRHQPRTVDHWGRVAFDDITGNTSEMYRRFYTVPSAKYISDDYRQMNLDLRIPIGQVVRDVRILDISDFEAFVKYRGWR